MTATLLCSAGCGLAKQKVVKTVTHFKVTETADPQPAKTKVVIKHLQRVSAGQTGEVANAAGVQLSITAGKPSVSHTHLGSYGDGPEHGDFVTFFVKIKNTGTQTVLIKPTQFFIDVGGSETHITSYEYAAPYSGEPQQLDSVPLVPGQSVSHPLTFDVDNDHGRLTYAPSGKADIIWTF